MASSGGDWSREECLLAIWAYKRIDKRPWLNHMEICRDVAAIIGRTPHAVKDKIENVSAFDPRPKNEKHMAERKHGQMLLGALFSEYGNDIEYLDDIHHEYSSLSRQGILEKTGSGRSAERMSHYIIEGDEMESSSKRRRRSRRLVNEARRYFRENDPEGLLKCAICGLSFDHLPGSGIIQIHHKEPIGEQETATRKLLREALKKVIPLCPTCHCLVHSAGTLLPAEEVLRIYSDARPRDKEQVQ